jgi:hypothetical protein
MVEQMSEIFFIKGDNVGFNCNNEAKGEILALHNDNAWVLVSNRIPPITCDISDLKKVGKFEHLRDLPVDTKVIVSRGRHDEKKENRYFSHVSEDGNEVFCFIGGQTSWSADGVNKWPCCEVVG